MKRIAAAVLCIAMCFALWGCGGDVRHAEIPEMPSEVYSREDIDAAIDTIISEFKKDWRGCTLIEICYAGDDALEGYAERADGRQVIVLVSSFNVDSSGGDGSLNPNSTYAGWQWILTREDGGRWQHVDHGY